MSTKTLQGICTSKNDKTIKVSFDAESGNILMETSSGEIFQLDISEVRKFKKTISACEQSYAEWIACHQNENNLKLF